MANAEPAPAANEVTIQLNVSVPANTPNNADIYVSGSNATLGTWNGKGLKLTKKVDGIYRGSFAATKGEQIAFKLTRGDWGTVEKQSNGGEIQNRRIDVDAEKTISIQIEAWADSFTQKRSEMKSTITGTVIIHENMESTYLKLPRTVRVYLPPNYDIDKEQHYPVLYMHDGQNLFDARTSAFGNEWQVDENAEELIGKGLMEPIIVVGIDNTAMRTDEYTPTQSTVRNAGGMGEAYAQFLIKELKPFIDTTYRTKPEKEFTGTAGSSLGGLISLYLGATHRDVFSRIGSVSPALGWDNNQIIRDYADKSEQYLEYWKDMRIWIDMGTLEGDIGGGGVCTVPLAEEIAGVLAKHGLKDGQEYKLCIVKDGLHNEPAWAARIDQILTYLYPPQSSSQMNSDK